MKKLYGSIPRFALYTLACYIGAIFYLADIFAFAQGTWIQRANFTANGRTNTVAFSIGTKGYVGTGGSGSASKHDFWEWDQITDTWSQKANFGGGARGSATGFSIGTKGYIGTGQDSAGNYLKDFWEWDQATNIWTQKTDLGGIYLRLNATGFSIGTKAYIGTGYGYPPCCGYLNDFWEWDQATNTWTQKANFAGGSRMGVTSFSIGGKGYIGMGMDNSSNYIDLWEWNPSTNIWTQKANFTGTLRWSYAFFSTTTKGYVGLGNNSSTAYNDVWSFNPATNTWSQIANFPGILSMGTRAGFAIGTKGYIVPGSGSQFWEYDTAVVCIDTASFTCAAAILEGTTNIFTNTSVGATSYIWKINGSNFATTTNTTYTFTVPGTFTVSLIAINGTCNDTASKVINVFQNPKTVNWEQKANFPGVGRHFAASFSIGGKGYVGTGVDDFSSQMFNDLWEYDTTLNAWTQKANFTGAARKGAVGFSIGTKGYIGTGAGGNFGPYYNDMWEWDQTSNTWIQKANFAGAARSYAVGFAIGSKGYLGTGSANATMFKDFWEWDQVTNTWLQKANFGGTSRQFATGFAIGTKGYIGTGITYFSGEEKIDFWEWNQATDTWTQKPNFNGNARYGAVSFAIGSKGYLGTGINSSGTYYSDFYEWDQASNSWTPKTYFCGGGRYAGIGFSIGSKGYVGTGYIGWSINDFWEFDTICKSHSSFIASATNINTGITVTFTNASSGSSSYIWQINGSNFATTNNSSYLFNTCGTYSISLIASNCSCSDTITQIISVAGTSWIQKSNINSGFDRSDAVGFSIGNNGYIGTGYKDVITNYNDFWEWNQASNIWTQKANVGGNTRRSAVGFSIGTKGYIGTGTDGSVAYQDFWEWNQSTNTWMQKASLPAARYESVGFSIGTKGYIGTGASSFGNYHQDFWEWDQANNTWSAKASFPGAARYGASCFSIGTKGYVGTGTDGTNYYQDFWEWDQTSNTWTQKTNLVGAARSESVGFSIGTKGYISTGQYWNGFNWTYYNDFWEWNQSSNTWLQYNFLGTARFDAVGFSIGTKGYIGTGYDGISVSGNTRDLWEYSPCSGPVAVNETNINNSTFAFPNPFSSQTTFIFGIEVKNASIKVYDVNGKEVRKIIFSGRKLVLERENMENGIYFYQIISENKNNLSGDDVIATGKLIIQ